MDQREIFERYNELGRKLRMLGAIIQNPIGPDYMPTVDNLIEWREEIAKVQDEIAELRMDTNHFLIQNMANFKP